METMERRAGSLGILPHSTAHRIVTRKTLPYTLAQFDAFLNACEVPMKRRAPWHAAWARVVGLHPTALGSELAKLYAPTPPEGHTRPITDTPNTALLIKAA
ncbi:hypothetical protein [Streptomyces chrestomyceticus]|uniref:hypothetical protein n=1 Tax=Streptomyces chrestomyceticus TaxID=68185 RepID=UPI0037BDA9CE